MIDDGPETFTIGQLARRTGLARAHHPVLVRHRRPAAGGPPHGGYRLYDAECVARLELVRTLRELGLSLDDVRRVPAREITVAQLAGAAQERGVAPESPEADALLAELLGAGADRVAVLERVGVSPDLRVERYFQLLAVINGYERPPSAAPPSNGWPPH